MELSIHPFCRPRLSRRVAQRLSDLSYQKYHNDFPSLPPLAFKTFAHQRFLEGFDVVILGHSHFPEEVEEWMDGQEMPLL